MDGLLVIVTGEKKKGTSTADIEIKLGRRHRIVKSEMLTYL